MSYVDDETIRIAERHPVRHWWREHSVRHWRLRYLKPLWSNFEWPAVLVLVLVAIVLGYVGLTKYFAAAGQTRSFCDICYLILQLFVLESGGVSGPVPWQLEFARLLAPVVPAWAIIKAGVVLFREQIRMLRLRCTSNHVVICGLGRKGLQLVKDFRRHGDRVVVIESNEQDDRIRICRDLGALVLLGDATEESLLRRARVYCAQHVVALCGDDGDNVEIAVHAYHLVRARNAKYKTPVRCFVQVVDLELCRLFRHHRIFKETGDPFEVRIFNTFENSARLLLHEHPLDRERIREDDPRAAHLVVIGFGRLGQSVALQAARTAHFANGKKLRLTAIDIQAEQRKKSFYSRYPQFDKVCDAEFLQANADDPEILDRLPRWANDKDTLSTIAVCLDDDSRCLCCALGVLSRLDGYTVPIMVRMAEEAGLATLLESSGNQGGRMTRVHAFGMTSRTCTRTTLLGEELDRLAKAGHQRQVEKRRAEGRPESDASMQPWERLRENFKDSSRQQADHIPVKLRAIGCYNSPPDPNKAPVTEVTPEEVELLAKMEHARWNAERWLDGWTLGPRDPDKKTTPYLVGWNELAEDIKEYDREPVRNIPHLLAMIGENVYR